LFKPVTVYICLGVAAFATEVDMARMLCDLRLYMAKSTMDSSDVAQRSITSGEAFASQSARVFLMEAAFSELGSMERRDGVSDPAGEERRTGSGTCEVEFHC
jgi:hypothetical protein